MSETSLPILCPGPDPRILRLEDLLDSSSWKEKTGSEFYARWCGEPVDMGELESYRRRTLQLLAKSGVLKGSEESGYRLKSERGELPPDERSELLDCFEGLHLTRDENHLTGEIDAQYGLSRDGWTIRYVRIHPKKEAV